jgi:hypothetical protein
MQLNGTIVAAFCLLSYASPCQASTIIVTWVQNLDLITTSVQPGVVGVSAGDPVPGLAGHPTITWTMTTNTQQGFYGGLSFTNPVMNQDAINDGVIPLGGSIEDEEFSPSGIPELFEIASYIQSSVDTAASLTGIYWFDYITNDTCLQYPCTQTMHNPYGSASFGANSFPLARYLAQTTDTFVTVLVPNPEPGTITLMAIALVTGLSRKSYLAKTRARRSPAEDRNARC